MKIKTFFLIALFGTIFVNCKLENPMKEFMVDSWETTYLKLEMPTYEKSDSLVVFEDKFDNNPERIAQSKYNKDGTFSAWFVDRNGDHISDSEGTWTVKGDSLFVEFFYDGRDMKVGYKITKTAEGFQGESIYDWDNDGDFDDFLLMKTKRISTQK